MKPSQVSFSAHPIEDPRQKGVTRERPVPPEVRQAAEGMEAIFAGEMLKAMRGTIEPSEFSLHNTATDVYQSLLDQEYSEIAARRNSLGLAEQIIDYMLRDQPRPTYNKNTGPTVGTVRTGGTNEGQSSE